MSFKLKRTLEDLYYQPYQKQHSIEKYFKIIKKKKRNKFYYPNATNKVFFFFPIWSFFFKLVFLCSHAFFPKFLYSTVPYVELCNIIYLFRILLISLRTILIMKNMKSKVGRIQIRRGRLTMIILLSWILFKT